MTLSRLSAADSSNAHRSSLSAVALTDNHKRKYDDYADCGVDFPRRMKRHEVDSDRMAASQQSWISRRSDEISGQNRSLSSAAECSSSSDRSQLQVFVRMISGSKTIVIQANRNGTVAELSEIIEQKTKIPAKTHRFIYEGKQLETEHTLSYYSMEQDASLHLLGRLRSTEHPVAWQTVDEIMHTISRIYRGENHYGRISKINEKIVSFFAMIPGENENSVKNYINIFSDSYVPAALVMLYASSLEVNKACAKSSIKLFLNTCTTLAKNQQRHCLPVVLEFCKLLRKVGPDQKLYTSSRSILGTIVEPVEFAVHQHREMVIFGKEIFPFFAELAELLVKEIDLNLGPSPSDVQKFSSFWQPLKKVFEVEPARLLPITFPLLYTTLDAEIENLYHLFTTLLVTMDKGMSRVEFWLDKKGVGNSETMPVLWSQYLATLKVIDSISDIYQGAKERVAGMLNSRKASFCALISNFAKRGDDNEWIFQYKEATNFEARRHLAMLLFPDVKEDFEEMHEMLIDRSNLLAESFEYITSASPDALHGGLFMEFKNEEATGPGVLREWFYLVCQEIFNQQNTLFLRSADDFRRFSPNPASKVDPLHPDFFEFTGRVIALALMHKIQVGVLFDRVFFLRLAGLKISLEDIKDTDRIMYNSCKQILEMDPVIFDSSAGLGLTFVLETEELGKRDTIELRTNGKSTAVDSMNREQYVDLLIEHRFATRISKQVEHFSRGFRQMLSDNVLAKTFFNRIYLEDLDWMLRGGENPINIDDWKAHTEYNGFKETDRQIDWFWKILKKMTEEERRSILFFWTSTKYIPVEGFKGLSSKLHIYRLFEANDRLPTSHTCFYRICLPKYPTMALMEQRLRLIAQDHVSSSFGKW